MRSRSGASETGRTKLRGTPVVSPVETVVTPAPPARWSIWLPWAVLLVAVAFAAIVRVRLLQIPLERDEGEYAYAGQLLLHGVPPYREAFNMKLPGVYAAYGLIMALFGQTIGGIHLGFLLCNAATILLVFLLGRRLFGATAGAVAAAAYALLSVSPGVYGTQAHATHFVVLPVLGACLLLLRALDRDPRPVPWLNGGLFASGVLFGTGIVMKQHAAIFALFGVVYLAWMARRDRKLLLVSAGPAILAGIALPLAVTGLAIAGAGVFSSFWFWTITYGRAYVSESSLSTGIDTFNSVFPHVVGANFLIWLFAGLGALLAWWHKADRPAALFATTLLLASFLAVCPGFYFREHYFVLMLPAVALLAGAAVSSLDRVIGRVLPAGLFAAILLFSIFQQSDFLYRDTPLQASRRMYSINPFPEAIPVGDYLRAHTRPGERIAVFGSEPEIYFYADRPTATGYIYTYGMMEPQPYALAMQNQMIHDIETVRPSYIVLVNASSSWVIRPTSLMNIFHWWNPYRVQHYRRVGVAEVLSPERTVYRWSNVESYESPAQVFLEIYQRKD